MVGSDFEDEAVSDCPDCGGGVMHEIIKRSRKGKGEDVLVRCLECDKVHTVMIRPPKLVMVSTTLSDGRESQSVDVEADEDEEITVGDLFEYEEISWRVTRIDNSDSRPEKILTASKIRSMWATRSDKTLVGLTMTNGELSESSQIECEPGRVFSCGSIMMVGGDRWRVRAIHTGRGRTLTGSRYAHEIRRVYLHLPENKYN